VLKLVLDTFPLFGLLNSFKEQFAASKSCERMCNELVADLTGLDIEQKPDEGTYFLHSFEMIWLTRGRYPSACTTERPLVRTRGYRP
jgi:hypothetical protein